MNEYSHTPCPANETGWHDLHGGCAVSESDLPGIALCRDCDQIIDTNGKVVDEETYLRLYRPNARSK